MKRRSFCRYFALGSACFAGIVGRESSFAMISHQSLHSKSRHRWVVLYWMPYDNDLDSLGEPIIEMLAEGTRDSEVVVAVQSDYFGDTKMRRRILTNGAIQEMDIVGEDSSDISALSKYLDWANQTFNAEHWALIVVGHGGKINENSPDAHGLNSQTTTWMGVDKFTSKLTQFNKSTCGRVELLFFQNCNKATLEIVYEARNCARYTLASQLELGAPNYYYKGFLERLKEPSVGGYEAAIAIMESERADMYHTLTLVDNQAVEQIPVKLSRLIQPLLDKNLHTVNLSALPTFRYFDEQHCDVLALLRHLSSNINQESHELSEFTEFLESSVIAYYKTGGKLFNNSHFINTDLNELCGLNLYLPQTGQAVSRYSSLALYKQVDLSGLYRGIFVS